MAFQGSLTELHLPDIVQLMSVSGKTGVFLLSDGPHQGEIFLREGQIVHAVIEDIQGEEAVYALAIWNKGEFRFDAGVTTDVRTISKSNTNLLMEAARRLDEWRVLSKKIPSVELAPEFVVLDGREGQINLNTGEWLILSKIDGKRSVKAIAAASGLSVFDSAKILYGLITTGLIRLRQSGAVAEPGGGAPDQPAAAGPQPAQPRLVPSPGSSPEASGTGEKLARLERVRETCLSFLGNTGESVVAKHYQKARADLERGAGKEAIEEAIGQIARATAILKGPVASEALLKQIRGPG